MWTEEVTGDSTRRIGYERYWSMHTGSFCSWIIECQRAVPRPISADSKLDLPHLRVQPHGLKWAKAIWPFIVLCSRCNGSNPGWSPPKSRVHSLWPRPNTDPCIVVDLKNLTLAGQDAIAFLDRCEANGITLKNYAARMNKGITAISEEFMTALVRHSWPGNVRELQTFIERSVVLSSGDVLSGSRPEVTNALKLSAPVTLEEAERSLYLLPHGRVAAWRSRNRNRDVWIVNGNAEPHLRV
jgi:hypothetical protein